MRAASAVEADEVREHHSDSPALGGVFRLRLSQRKLRRAWTAPTSSQSPPTSFVDGRARRRSSQGHGRSDIQGPKTSISFSRQNVGRTRTCRAFRASPQSPGLQSTLSRAPGSTYPIDELWAISAKVFCGLEWLASPLANSLACPFAGPDFLRQLLFKRTPCLGSVRRRLARAGHSGLCELTKTCVQMVAW